MPALYDRRTFLQLLAASGAAVSLPWLQGCGGEVTNSAVPAAAGEAHFFTAAERRLIEDLAAAVVPEDQTVGARGTNVVEYIDRFLAVFDNDPPPIYRGGPFSGRTPYPDATTGAPTTRFPTNDFQEVLPLSRMQELSFRVLLYGSDAVPNGNINAPIVAPSKGLRAIYREAIAALDAAATAAGAASFSDLDDPKARGPQQAPPDFRDALLTHIAEGMFCAPEYGGNQDLRGWRDYFFDGDSQPLGHTLFNRETQTLYDRPDQPNQTIDPNQPNNGLEPSVVTFTAMLTALTGGKRFF